MRKLQGSTLTFLSLAGIFTAGLTGCNDDTSRPTSESDTLVLTTGASDSASQTSATPEPTTGEEPTTSAGSDSASASAGGTGEEETGSFIIPGDTDGGAPACDVWGQDCPRGEKCAAYADDGGNAWNAAKCVPVTGDDAVGDECFVEGSGVSGIDSCVKGAICWNVDANNKGECVALCEGDQENPGCDTGFECAIVNDGVLNVCLPGCEPILQDCPQGEACYLVNEDFICAFDASGDLGFAFDPCEFINSCDAGLICAASESATECDPNAGGCCLPFCDIGEPSACDIGQGLECSPLFEQGQAPIGLENVGVCALPG